MLSYASATTSRLGSRSPSPAAATQQALAALLERAERSEDRELRRYAAVLRMRGDLDRLTPTGPHDADFVDLGAELRLAMDESLLAGDELPVVHLPGEAVPIHADPFYLREVLAALLAGFGGAAGRCVVRVDLGTPPDLPESYALASLTITARDRKLSTAELARHVAALAQTDSDFHGTIVARRFGECSSFDGPGLRARVDERGTFLTATWPVDLG